MHGLASVGLNTNIKQSFMLNIRAWPTIDRSGGRGHLSTACNMCDLVDGTERTVVFEILP